MAYVQNSFNLPFISISACDFSIYRSKESNTISSKTIVSQNWCILSKDDEYVKFSIFSEVYDGGIFQTLEPKMEPPQLPIPQGPASKFEKSMFFEAASLNIIQNFIFKLWIEQDDSWADFDIHKWSLFWSPWSPTAKNTLKI